MPNSLSLATENPFGEFDITLTFIYLIYRRAGSGGAISFPPFGCTNDFFWQFTVAGVGRRQSRAEEGRKRLSSFPIPHCRRRRRISISPLPPFSHFSLMMLVGRWLRIAKERNLGKRGKKKRNYWAGCEKRRRKIRFVLLQPPSSPSSISPYFGKQNVSSSQA